MAATYAARPRPAEVQAVYPHRHAVPDYMWLNLFKSAGHKIEILDMSGLFFTERPRMMAALSERARVGVRLRICLAHPDLSHQSSDQSEFRHLRSGLPRNQQVEIRQHHIVLSSAIYIADDEMLVNQYVYGIPPSQAPVLHLRAIDGELMPLSSRPSNTYGVPLYPRAADQ